MSLGKDEDIELTSLQDEDTVSQSAILDEDGIKTISEIGREETDQNDDITANRILLEVVKQPESQTDNQALFNLPRFFQHPVLAIPNLVFLLLDVCLPVIDIGKDIQITYIYWSRSNFTWNERKPIIPGYNFDSFTVFGVAQVYSVGFIASVIILTLPSLSLMVDLVVKKDCTSTSLLKALLYPFHMVFEGVKCFINPAKEGKRNKFQISKENEIILESTLQIFLQCGILLFELLDSKTKNRIFMRERKFEIMSILISVLTLSFGICSCKMNMQFQSPNLTLKLKLFIRSSIDVVPRIATLLSVIVLSLDWKYGVLFSTMLICLLLFAFPYLGFFYNKLLHGTSSLSDRTNIFLPLTTFKSVSLKQISSSKWSRIENKMVSSMLMMLIISTEALVIWKIIPLSSTHIWFDCYNRKTEIQFILLILWGAVSLCTIFSSLEIIYFYCTNKTWIEFIYADDENPSDDKALNDVAEEATVHNKILLKINLKVTAVLSAEKTAGLALIITAIISVTLFLIDAQDLQLQRPTNFTKTDLENFIVELKTTHKNYDLCECLSNKSQSDVVYTMHELIGIREYDELVIAMVSCKPTPSTFLTYKDKHNNERNDTALMKAITINASTEIIERLLKYYPEEINARSEKGLTPIMKAAHYNNKLIPNLIAHGALSTDTDIGGQNILHKKSVNKELIQQFQSLVNKGSCNGYTPLHHACRSDGYGINIVEAMLENGGDPDVMDTDGLTSKDYCCISCDSYSDCAEKCKLIQGGSTPINLCQQNPWNVLVVQDVFNSDEIKVNSKGCCSSCKNKECTLSCEIIEKGYSSKEICSASLNFLLKLEEYLYVQKIYSLVVNYAGFCRMRCKSEHCINNIKLIDRWFLQRGYGIVLEYFH